MWRRAGHHVVPVALVAALMLAAPAAAQLRATDQTLTGSSFQGGDGNQADAPPLIDWQALQAAGRVVHSPDPNDEDSVFAGGNAARETAPGDWDLTTKNGSTNTSNILDAWSAVDQPGADTFLYLGYTRAASNGTTFMAFELNHDARLWNNGNAMIPCRRDGDVQVSFEQRGSNPDEVRVVVRRWTTTDTDEASGCDTVGDLEREFAGTVNVQSAFNSGPITSRLPGAFTPGSTVQDGLFGEAAVNLTKLLQQTVGQKCMAFNSIWVHTRASLPITSNMDDYVAPQPLSVKTCSASGIKFYDSNRNAQPDAGERGIPRFLIWADYDNDGMQDANEPYSVTDSSGRYEIHDIRPTNADGTYWLRERLLGRRRLSVVPAGVDWQCSYPKDGTPGGTGSAPGGRWRCAWGPIDVNATPYAQGRDFGNWLAARLTVRKRLFPSDDPGRFALLIGDDVVVPEAGDRASGTRNNLAPGTYTVSERPVGDTDPAAYRTLVWCQDGTSGAPTTTVQLSPGESGVCTFYNVRPGTPAIAIRKRGPAVAMAGDALPYRLIVRNVGDVSFAADRVKVTDEQCDNPPRRVSPIEDQTPGMLDPGDRWLYRCRNSTAPAGDDCEPTRVLNEAEVRARARGRTVSDDTTFPTILLCPDNPVPPIPPIPPTPGPEPEPVVPPGPTPPDAGSAGIAGLIFERTVQGCIGRRVPRVNLSGVRIASVRIYVDGRFIRGLTLKVLQRRHRPRVTLAPGQRYRIRVRVTFQRGTDSPPVTLIGTIRTCARPPAACPSGASEPGARVACASSAVLRRWRRPT